MSDIFDIFKSLNLNKTKPEPIKFLVVGLGNPGKQYENTRHNAGFMTIDYIAKKFSTTINRIKFNSLVSEVEVNNKRIMLMKPQTFMNLSGKAVQEAASFYKIPPENIIVIYDDISLDPGNIRIRRKGSAGGHNGIKSIIECIGSEKFPRIKVGVGKKPSSSWDLADWVLSSFSESDKDLIVSSFDKSYNSMLLMLEDKSEEAMNKYNS